MNIFRKSSVPKARTNEVMVSVPDLKDYLVQEYEKARQADKIIADLQKETASSEEVRQLYEASLVTLDEYAKRLDLKDEKIKELEAAIRVERVKTRDVNNKCNDMGIKLHNLQIEFDTIEEKAKEKATEDFFNSSGYNRIIEDAKEEALDSFCLELSKLIDSHKGNLSKDIVRRWISN